MEDPDLSSSHPSSSEDEDDPDYDKGKGPSPKRRKRGPRTPKEGPVICEECGKSIKSKRLLTDHKRRLHNPNSKDYECPECLLKYKVGSSLWSHYCQKHMDNKYLPVDIQPLIVGGNRGVKAGSMARSSPASTSTICGICGKMFSQAGCLKRHYVNEHEAPGMRYPCPECGKDFKDQGWRNTHRRLVHGVTSARQMRRRLAEVRELEEGEVERQMCEECGEMVESGKEWGKHLREKHKGGDQWSRWLEEEKMRNNERRKLEKREMRKRIRENGVGPDWLVKEQLEKGQGKKKVGEKRVGQGERSYKCGKEGCGLGFGTKKDLRMHLIEVHFELEEKIVKLKIIKLERKSGEFRCTLCGRGFGHRAEVKIHVVRDHPEVYRSILEGTEVTRRCPMEGCEEEMEGEAAVRKHLEERHGEDCFRCPECEMVMLSPEEMDEHWEKMHGGDQGEGEVEGIWMWSRKPNVWSSMKGVIGEEERMEVSRKWQAVYSKYNGMKMTCEICGLGLNFQGYKRHLRIVHGVVEGEWRCEICEREGKRYGAMAGMQGGIQTREGWLTHLQWMHGDEVKDMEGMVERARKMNVEGGVEGLDKIHWKKWTNGRLVEGKRGKERGNAKRKKRSKERKGGKGKRKVKRTIREIKVKELKLSERLKEMVRELEREKRLVIGPLERVKERKTEVLYLDINS